MPEVLAMVKEVETKLGDQGRIFPALQRHRAQSSPPHRRPRRRAEINRDAEKIAARIRERIGA